MLITLLAAVLKAATAAPRPRIRKDVFRIVDLHGGALLAIDAAAGARVRVLHGTVWLTEPGRRDDVFAASGAQVPLERGGRVLIEALGFARVAVPQRQQGSFVMQWLDRLRLTTAALAAKAAA